MISRFLSQTQRLRAALGYRAGKMLNNFSVALENRWPSDSHDRVVILDDMFPNVLTAFRVAEFNTYLERFDEVEVYSTTRRFQFWIEEYGRSYPQFKNSVRPYHDNRILRGKGAYIVFLHNAFRFLEKVEKAALPFIFTLYPGGEFRLDERGSDERLQRVFSSSKFQKVIVTQKLTRDYVIERGFCDPSRIEFVFGVVVPSNQLYALPHLRRRYGIEKDVLDICFVGHKQMPRGMDKGYDRFIGAARLLARQNQRIHFHVVGQFDESDVDIGNLSDRISYYGTRYTSFFPGFYASMDIILSPNIPFVLAPGAFDGFPTGCCIEAGLCGVAVFCTDELAMNNGTFKDREEIVIIPREPQEICEIVQEYVARPDLLAELATKGQQAFRSVFDLDKQMEPRLRLLSNWLNLKSAEFAQSASASLPH